MKTPCAHPGAKGQNLPESAENGNWAPRLRAANSAGLQEDSASGDEGQQL